VKSTGALWLDGLQTALSAFCRYSKLNAEVTNVLGRPLLERGLSLAENWT
jgi:hypothetical protein